MDLYSINGYVYPKWNDSFTLKREVNHACMDTSALSSKFKWCNCSKREFLRELTYLDIDHNDFAKFCIQHIFEISEMMFTIQDHLCRIFLDRIDSSEKVELTVRVDLKSIAFLDQFIISHDQ
jgi:hypothetical protein